MTALKTRQGSTRRDARSRAWIRGRFAPASLESRTHGRGTAANGGQRRERRTVRPGTAADKGGERAYRRGTCREEWSIRDHHKGCGTRGAGSTRGNRCQVAKPLGLTFDEVWELQRRRT